MTDTSQEQLFERDLAGPSRGTWSRERPEGPAEVQNRRSEEVPQNVDKVPQPTGARRPAPVGGGRDLGRDLPTLTSWLAGLKQRDLGITAQDHQLHLTGNLEQATPTDHHMLTRHAHALQVAAAGTHPNWWRYVAGHSQQPPAPDQLPTTPDPTSDDGLNYPCATCGQPAVQIDGQLLAWCTQHDPRAQP